MGNGYVIYNPFSGDGKSKENSAFLEIFFDDDLEYFDITKITNYQTFFGGMAKEDYIIIAGGDGTLNHFINDTEKIKIPQEIFYFPTGSGNDFAKDAGKTDGNPFRITEHLKNLPTVEVNGKKYRFINGVGFGRDGYCCEVGDKLKETSEKKVDYTKIAIKGLLFRFSPRNAKITVDGKEYLYKKVWIAPTMFGRYYGGGMMAAPAQNRWNGEGTLSLLLFHSAGRLRTLCIFPGIFKGKHIKHKKSVALHTGKEIEVEFDRPTPLQIDGETICDVISYKVSSWQN